MLKITKKIYILITVLVFSVFLASCKKTKKYVIQNDDQQLIIKKTNGDIITPNNYLTNKEEVVLVSLDLLSVKEEDEKITKQVTVNSNTYVFTPLDKTYEVKLDSKNPNKFVSQKESRKTVLLNFDPFFFTVTHGNSELTSPSEIREAAKITVSTKNLPENIVVEINKRDQALNQNLIYIIIGDTTIRYHLAGEETISDEDILNNQLKQLRLVPTFPNTPNLVTKSFLLPKIFDQTIKQSFQISSGDNKHFKIADGKFLISDEFTGEQNITITCSLQRNNIIKTKDFHLTVRKNATTLEVSKETLLQFLKDNNYFLSFVSNDNINNITHDFYAFVPAETSLSFTILDSNNFIAYDSAKLTFNLNKDKKIEQETKIKVKVEFSYQAVTVNEEFYIYLQPLLTNLKVIEKEVSIANAITISPSDLEFNGKKVTRREINPLFLTLVTTNKSKTKFIFNSPNKYQVLYQIYYEDGTSEKVRYIYNVKLPSEFSYVNRYLKTLENSANDFISLNTTTVLQTPKVVGTSNSYLPDIVCRYNGEQLNQDKTDFEKQEIDVEIDFSQRLFTIVVKDQNNNQQTSGLYQIIKGGELQFEEQEEEDKIYTIEYYLQDTEKLLFSEKIMVKKGVNAYTDEELRSYFRQVLDYESIFLQRNIKVLENRELVKTKNLPSGINLTYRDYDNLHKEVSTTTYIDKTGKIVTEEKPLFDSEGNITDEHRYFQGSIYYRYFSINGSKKDQYKPVKFNGNYYRIDASQINRFHHEDSFMAMPNIQAGIFDIDCPQGYALPYYKENEIKNIQIIGNGGISGETIAYDKEGQKLFSVLSGSLHGIRTRWSRVNIQNITAKDNNIVVWSDASETNIDKLNCTNSFSSHLWFRNREGILLDENRDIPMTRMTLTDSYLGETGGLGIMLTDADSRHRMKTENMADYLVTKQINGKDAIRLNDVLHNKLNGEHHQYNEYDRNNKDERIKYSCDPTVVISGTRFEAWASTQSSLVKTFNIADTLDVIKEKEEAIAMLGIKVLRPDSDNSIKLNVPLVMLNNTLVDDKVPEFYDEHNNIKEDFFSKYDSPRWEVKLNDSYQYHKADIQYTLSAAAKEKLEPFQFIITYPGADFVDYFNDHIDSESPNAMGAIAGHLVEGVNHQKGQPLNNFLQVFPIVEFPLFNNGSQTKRIYISAILSYEEKK